MTRTDGQEWVERMPHIGFQNKDLEGTNMWMLDLASFRQLVTELEGAVWATWRGDPIKNIFVILDGHGYDIVMEMRDEGETANTAEGGESND